MNVPVLLSFYRLAAAPLAAWIAVEGYREAFYILDFISLLSDLVDGPIARWLGQDSSFGAKLDTIADACTLLAGIFGVCVLEAENIQPDLFWLYLFLASYAAAATASLIKFRGLPAYHLYTSKAAAFCSAVFFVWLYLIGFSREFFVAVIGLGVIANVESLLLTMHLRASKTDIGSILFVVSRSRDSDS